MESMNPYSTPSAANELGVLEYDGRLSTCPRCGEATEEGFAIAETRLFTPRLNVLKALSIPEPLAKMSWWSRQFSFRVKYVRAHLCRSCGCCIVDSSKVLSLAEAKRLAASQSNPPPTA